jgi:phage shock protein A
LEKKLDSNRKYISKLEEALNKENDKTGKEFESEKQQLDELIKKIDIKLEEVEKVIQESIAKIKTMENRQKTTDTDKFKCFECHQQFDSKKTLNERFNMYIKLDSLFFFYF